MTREEEISKALSQYVKNRGVSGNHIVDVERDAAFIAGALFADRNPDLSLLWHDASEEPEDGYLLYKFDENKYSTMFLHHHFGESIWKIWCRERKITRWAYIDDLYCPSISEIPTF